MPFLAAAFLLATALWTAASLVLSRRQTAYVQARREAPPADFLATCSIEDHRRAADYVGARERLARWETVAEAVLAAAWALGGVNLVYGWVAAVAPVSLARSVAFLLVAALIGALVGLPFDLGRTFWIEQTFGFNRTTLRRFAIDRAKRAMIALAVSIPLLAALLLAMERLSGLWWLWTWFALLAILLVAPSIFLRWIAPRFNRFDPLPAGPLRARIESLLDRAGFRASGLFTMDASRRTSHGNAFFTGFGRTKRIVLFDTLVAKCPPEEIEAVVAHELGHFLYRHIFFAIARAGILLFFALAAFGWLTKQPWLLPAFGVAHRDDALALFVCMLLIAQAGPILAPGSNWISRRNEYQADDYARRMVGVEPIVNALLRLARDNASTLTPDPLYSLVHDSHPSVALRVRALRAADGGSRDRAGGAALLPAQG